MTPCGHNFCRECILECINRKHVCPCCNKEVVQSQLIKNHQYDKLLSMINAEKEAASKQYFAQLINKGGDGTVTQAGGASVTTAGNGGEKGGTSGKGLSPIEALFHQHLKRSLMAYEDYYTELREKYLKSQTILKDSYAAQMGDAQSKLERKLRKKKKSASIKRAREKTDATINSLTERCSQELERLQLSFEHSVALLQQSYETYMKEHMPAPRFLPVTVSLVVPHKRVRFDNVVLKPTDALVDVKLLLVERLQQSGNPLTSFSPSARFVLRKPFLVGGAAAGEREGQSSTSSGGSSSSESGVSHEEVPITDEMLPILQYGVEPGSEIVLVGDVLLESDKPKQCFTAVFQKDKGMVCDYYTCKDCNFNWICQACSEECHKGHSLVPYIKNHVPTWACCYCVKKRCGHLSSSWSINLYLFSRHTLHPCCLYSKCKLPNNRSQSK
ncbi:RING-type domain-containing protein, variant 4 [Balamuthia mandrillaris]